MHPPMGDARPHRRQHNFRIRQLPEGRIPLHGKGPFRIPSIPSKEVPMIKFRSGDMFSGGHDVLVNTVNCVGVMGAGLALQFRRRFPLMHDRYREECRLGLVRPGRMNPHLEGTVLILNFPTKDHWRDPSRYEWIAEGLVSLRAWLSVQDGGSSAAIPPLGCGLGGLDWKVVRPMILEVMDGLDMEVCIYGPES